MEYKHRAIESELKKALQTFPAVLVTGSRQAGKTSLLRNILPNYRYVSFDRFSDLQGVKEDPSLFLAWNSDLF